MQRQRQTRMAAEQQVKETQQEQLVALQQGFAPNADQLDIHVKQAAAFRSGTTNRPYQDVLEEERLDEGSRRASRFQKSIEGLSPLQLAEFGVMAAGLQKEGLPASEYQRILEAVRSSQPLDKFSPEQIEKANRIYRATEGEDLIQEPTREPFLTDPSRIFTTQQEAIIAEVEALGTASEYAHAKGRDVEDALARVLEVNSLTEESYDSLNSDDRIFAISKAMREPFPGASNAAFNQLLFRERPVAVDPIRTVANIERLGQEAGAVATTAIRVGAEEVLPGEGRPSLEAFQEGGIEGAIERSIDENVEIFGIPIGPSDLLNPLNLIPLPFIDPLIARLISIPVRIVARLGGKITTQIARVLGREAAEKATDETLDAATRTALRDFSTEIVPTAQGAPLETAGVRRGLKTGDEVALVSDPSTSAGRIIAQSDQGVTIRPEGGGKPFLRSRGRVQAVEGVPEGARPAILEGAPDEELMLFRGLGREGDELIEGAHLTPNRQHAQVFADADARLTGGEARVVEVQVRRSALDPIDAAESPLAASQGAVRLRDPSGARVVTLGEVVSGQVGAGRSVAVRAEGGTERGTFYVGDDPKDLLFHPDSPQQQTGFGGRTITIKDEAGRDLRLKGPSNSNDESFRRVTGTTQEAVRQQAFGGPARPVEPGAAPAAGRPLLGRPLAEQTTSPQLFHETSADNARQFLEDATIPDVAPFSGRAGVFVADTPELALGQRGRGATVVFDSTRVSGRQQRPPGQPPEMARELGTNFVTEDAATGSVLEVRFSGDALKADRVTNRWLQNVEQFSQGKQLRGSGPVLTVERLPDGGATVRVGERSVEPGVAPARAAEPPPRAAPSKAGTPEFEARSAVTKARLQAILDDPKTSKIDRQNAKKHFDKVCT